MSFGNDLFWNEVSGSHETQRKSAALVHGKVAAATWWPFLAHSEDESDFENRLSLVSAKIEASVQADAYEDVLSSLRDDFGAVHEASRLSAGSTSPELADLNAGLGSHGGTLDHEIFDHSAGRWVTAKPHNQQAKDYYKPKHSTDGDEEEEEDDNDSGDSWEAHKFKKEEAREKECPKCRGYGQLDSADGPKCNNCDGTGTINKKATNYQPDPNAGWRYHPGYENLSQVQLNNGALQDSDGFVKDLAQGEDRANPIIEQRQLTPGTWTEHDGMPERPMPFSQERGYRPVNAAWTSRGKDKENGQAYYDGHFDGASDAYQKLDRNADDRLKFGPDTKEFNDDQAYNYRSGYNDAHGHWTNVPRNRPPVRRSPVQASVKEATGHRFDVDGFLVTAYEGRGVDPLVDPVPGAAQRVNPFYFNPAGAMGANEGFPQDPGPEPLADRANTYGDVQPQMSSGSETGTIDGRGYSKGHPGESPDFSQGGKTANFADDEAKKDWRRERPSDDHGDYDLTDYRPHQGSPAWHEGPDDNPWTVGNDDDPWNEHKHSSLGESTRHSDDDFMERQHDAGHHDEEPDEDCWKCERNEHTAATNGQIVDHCPGCDQPRRVHSTMHGDEIRHLHNNHVRCHGSKTATMPPGSSVEPEDSATPEDDSEGDMAMTGSVLPQFFDPTLSNGSVHTADYLGRPDTNNLEGRGDNAFDAFNWDKLREQKPVQSLEDMHPNTPGADVRAQTNRSHDERGIPGRRAESGDDEAEDEED